MNIIQDETNFIFIFIFAGRFEILSGVPVFLFIPLLSGMFTCFTHIDHLDHRLNHHDETILDECSKKTEDYTT